MKKHLLLGLFALILSATSFAQPTIAVYTENPVNQNDITNRSVVLRATIASTIALVSVKALAYVILGNDTLFTDTVSGTATPSGTEFSFWRDSLMGHTEYWYNVKAWLESDTDAVHFEEGVAYTFTTDYDPVRSEPTGDAVLVGATSATIMASGSVYGHIAGWYAEWGEMDDIGFPYHTDTVYVDEGQNQVQVIDVLSNLTPATEYKFRMRSYSVIPGLVMVWIEQPTNSFTTDASSFALVGFVNHSDVTQDSATIIAQGTLGTNGSALMNIQIARTADTTVIDETGWVPFDGNSLSHSFGGFLPDSMYLYRAEMQDGSNVDSSLWRSFTTPQVPAPSVVVDSIHEFGDGGTPHVFVNQNGTWSGSATTTLFIFWWQNHAPDTMVMTGSGALVFPSITDVPAGTDVFYRACATNDGGTVCTNVASFDTDDPYAQVLLAIDQTFTMGPTSILLDNCEYTCAPGDTASLWITHGLSDGFYTDTTFIGFINGMAVQDITLTDLDPGVTHYFKLIALNSSNVWSWSPPRSEQTDPAQQPSALISTTAIVEQGATIRVIGNAGGNVSVLNVQVKRDDNGFVAWSASTAIGNDSFDETYFCTGLTEGESYTVWACVDNVMGQNCFFETFQTPTGIMELVMTQNLFVTAYDVLARPVASGSYRDVIAQLPEHAVYVLRDQRGDRVGVINKLK